ncbi:uncharacterized protein OCT59_022143 [Rhizophagus irregularis]|nr:hypothetical protein OCT59_022143 [Rhizophagus irregularis]
MIQIHNNWVYVIKVFELFDKCVSFSLASIKHMTNFLCRLLRYGISTIYSISDYQTPMRVCQSIGEVGYYTTFFDFAGTESTSYRTRFKRFN